MASRRNLTIGTRRRQAPLRRRCRRLTFSTPLPTVERQMISTNYPSPCTVRRTSSLLAQRWTDLCVFTERKSAQRKTSFEQFLNWARPSTMTSLMCKQVLASQPWLNEHTTCWWLSGGRHGQDGWTTQQCCQLSIVQICPQWNCHNITSTDKQIMLSHLGYYSIFKIQRAAILVFPVLLVTNNFILIFRCYAFIQSNISKACQYFVKNIYDEVYNQTLIISE